MKLFTKVVVPVLALGLLAMSPTVAEAQNCSKNPSHPRCGGNGGGNGGNGGTNGGNGGGAPAYFSWMDADVGTAFSDGFTGAGTNIIVLDNFGGSTYDGQMDGTAATDTTTESLTTQSLTHGGWTSLQASLVAPGATMVEVDQPSGRKDRSSHISSYYSADAVLNVVNLSFGLFDPADTVIDESYSLGFTIWDSIVDEARTGEAIFVKASGNLNGAAADGIYGIGFPFPEAHRDYLNLQLIGASGAIFVGALDGSGATASYSAVAGTNVEVQNMYVVVRVDDAITGLEGTSFAAPIVSGYAAIIGDKYSDTLVNETNPGELVVDRLLETAQTFDGYSVELHGMGEACLSCALSPASIPR